MFDGVFCLPRRPMLPYIKIAHHPRPVPPPKTSFSRSTSALKNMRFSTDSIPTHRLPRHPRSPFELESFLPVRKPEVEESVSPRKPVPLISRFASSRMHS